MNSNGLTAWAEEPGGNLTTIRKHGNESHDPNECLKFYRARQLAHHVSDASESELLHLSYCNECGPRLDAFRETAGTSPDALLEQELHVLDDGQHHGDEHESVMAMAETHAFVVFLSFSATDRNFEEHARRGWHLTHALSRAIRQSMEVHTPRGTATVIDGMAAGFVAAASTYVTTAHSADAVWPMVECVNDAVFLVAGEGSGKTSLLRQHYIKLYGRLLTETPHSIRHLFYGGLSDLLSLGEEAEAIAGAVLRDAVAGEHGDEAKKMLDVLAEAHPALARSIDHDRSSPAATKIAGRIAGVRKSITAALASGPFEMTVQEIRAAFAHWFDSVSIAWHVFMMIVVRAGIAEALAGSVRGDTDDAGSIRALQKALFGLDPDRRLRPFIVDIKVFEGTRHAHPAAWSETLIQLLRCLPSFQQHAVIRSAAAALDAMTARQDSPPKFERFDESWTFVADVEHSGDRFWHALAKLANESTDYDEHVRWARSRWHARKGSTPRKRTQHA